ncbi:NUDIX domain-containing protein [Phyllobacterium leguminum]|uniref:GDP-mannose pyrophosphatase n=1 Tax=Phyllobacterium leguminum TaxID=314237 RepID=A0A318T783_9HYPH|nr:NUDIX domain-containing protein [Phyllobacterium leguminum]PYE88975.1 nudix-type nucleoside diphosphatase (YffH/AdpP family) [Phyllobacterium leguminum]
MSVKNRIRINEVSTLSNDWYVLKKTSFDWLRSDGSWQTMSRETYDRGNGATLLPYDPARRTVLLTRQFRFPAYVNGYDELLIEAAAGLLDEASPEERIRKEVEEELGLVLGEAREIFNCFMSPGSVTERLHFFIAEYDPAMRKSSGGGNVSEGEDIEVLELGLDEALAMIGTGAIQDGKTILLLQYAALNLMPSA